MADAAAASVPGSAGKRTAAGTRGTILFAGGGTGGHLSPGLAIAEACARTCPGLSLLFACSDRAIDAMMLGEAAQTFVPMPARPFGAKPGALMRFARGWRASVRRAAALVAEHDVRAVIALGGFVAAPVVAGVKKRDPSTPALLLNLDAVPGKANRLLAKRCDRVISTCDTPGFSRFGSNRVAMPLRRRALASTFGDRTHCRAALGLDPQRKTLFITGASQGSQSLNDLMALIARTRRDLLGGWQIYHLTGHGREGDIARIYAEASIDAKVEPFQTSMGLAWGAADLVISRAGANSVAEIASNAVPAILMPYPWHHDRHQFENARPLESCGGAIVAEDFIDAGRNLEAHGAEIASLLKDDLKRERMRGALESQRPSNGAEEVSNLVSEMILESEPTG